MASVEQRLTAWALSLVQALETDAQMRVRVLALVIGTVVTIIMWVGHITYPYVLQVLLDGEVELKFIAAFALAPPFTAAFSVGHLIFSSTRSDRRGRIRTNGGIFLSPISRQEMEDRDCCRHSRRAQFYFDGDHVRFVIGKSLRR